MTQATAQFGFDPSVRVLCSDFTWRPAARLCVGDKIIAFDDEPGTRGKHRKLRTATVEVRGYGERPSYRVQFTNGRCVVASAEHLWLKGRGLGANPVFDCRVCGQVFQKGQGLTAHQRYAHGFAGIWQQNGFGTWIATKQLHKGYLVKNLGVPWEEDNSREAGYLAGVFDGEASFARATSSGAFCISFPQLPGPVLDCVRCLLKEKGFRTYEGSVFRDTGVVQVPVRGIYDCFRFLGQMRPLRLLARSPAWIDGQSPFSRHGTGSAEVESVKFAGNRDLILLGTSTKTLFAEGLFSHGMA